MAHGLDELFEQLKLKIAGLDLLGAINNDLPILVELMELVSHLVRLETPAAISAFSIDLGILLDLEISVANLKKSSAILVEEKSGALSQQ